VCLFFRPDKKGCSSSWLCLLLLLIAALKFKIRSPKGKSQFQPSLPDKIHLAIDSEAGPSFSWVLFLGGGG